MGKASASIPLLSNSACARADTANNMSRSENDASGTEGRAREHPTRTLLIDTVRNLLTEHAAHAITADLVLTTSGVSKGSLYHFFEDLEDLIGTAMVREFASASQANITFAQEGLARCDSTPSALALIGSITRRVRASPLHRHRMNRVSLIGFARGNEKLRRLLAAEQPRLTDAIAGLLAEAQQRGLLDAGFDARAGAVLFQSVSFGQVVDEISDNPLDDDAWNRIVDTLMLRLFAPQA